jgi:Asp-tRNA(Asn)/Glu-tRNA(Gln) amidotransferase C subunit
MRADLEERKEESRSLRRQFDSVTEHVDVLTEFLEKLRNKTAGYECAICGGGQPNTANASI